MDDREIERPFITDLPTANLSPFKTHLGTGAVVRFASHVISGLYTWLVSVTKGRAGTVLASHEDQIPVVTPCNNQPHGLQSSWIQIDLSDVPFRNPTFLRRKHKTSEHLCHAPRLCDASPLRVRCLRIEHFAD